MDINEAKSILENSGYFVEARTDYMAGEKGGEKFFNLPNDYDKTRAKQIYLSGMFGDKWLDKSTEEIDEYVENHLSKYNINKFYKNYEQFEKYKNGAPIRLYRGITLKDGEELDTSDLGVCWTFNRYVAKEWVIGIYKQMEFNHFMNGYPRENLRLYILSGTTDLSNCRLLYSLWLAGKFDRNECEVRIKDNNKIKLTKLTEITYR